MQAISIYGIDCKYIPRNITNFDQFYLTDDQSNYTIAIPTDVYIQNNDFGPGQNLYTKFGLEIQDNFTASLSRRFFEEYIQPATGKSRPDEGDLLYFDLNKKCFIIRYVNNKEIFYEFGILPTYQLTCELFQYSDETFNTGIPEIDSIQKKSSLNVKDNALETENKQTITFESGMPITIEGFDLQNIDPVVDTDYIGQQTTGNTFIDTSQTNPLGGISSLE